VNYYWCEGRPRRCYEDVPHGFIVYIYICELLLVRGVSRLFFTVHSILVKAMCKIQKTHDFLDDGGRVERELEYY